MSDSHPELPFDSDAIAVHLRPRHLALVALGGAVGTGAREGLTLLFPSVDGVPVVLVAINVVGALVLGILVEYLVRSGPDEGSRRDRRLLLGTGVLGGFTTYSALAATTATLTLAGHAGLGITFALVTLFVGAGASWAGIALGALTHRARHGRTETGG